MKSHLTTSILTVIILVLQVSTECEHGVTHPLYCEAYLVCVNEQLIKMQCPAPLWFNIELGACDYTENLVYLDAASTDAASTPDTTTTTKTTITPKTTTTSATPATPATRETPATTTTPETTTTCKSQPHLGKQLSLITLEQ